MGQAITARNTLNTQTLNTQTLSMQTLSMQMLGMQMLGMQMLGIVRTVTLMNTKMVTIMTRGTHSRTGLTIMPTLRTSISMMGRAMRVLGGACPST
jgi:hypothetical protein